MALDLKNRKTLAGLLATLVTTATLIVSVLFFGGTEEKDREIVETVCEQFGDIQLFRVRIGDTTSCGHGPDPRRPFVKNPPRAAGSPLITDNRLLCKGDGTTGPRVHAYLGSPGNAVAITDQHRADALYSIQFAETQFRRSHADYYQGIRWLCAGGKVEITEIGLPSIRDLDRYFFTVEDFLSAQGFIKPNEITAIMFVGGDSYPYCGEGSLFPDDRPGPANEMADDPQVSITACIPGDTLVHELIHNFGGVHDGAPGSSGAGHCFEATDVECYPDGGPYFANGGDIKDLCPSASFYAQLDCRKDSYWSPLPKTKRRGYLSRFWNIADSPYLSRPRRRG